MAPHKRNLDQGALLSSLATEHFRAVADRDKIYSLPADGMAKRFDVQPLQQRAQPRSTGLPASGTDQMVPDTDAVDCLGLSEGEESVPDERGTSAKVFFKFVHAHPSQQHTLPLPLAAGALLRSDHLVVTILDVQVSAAGATGEQAAQLYSLSGRLGAALADRVVTLSYLHSDAGRLRRDLQQHTDTLGMQCQLTGAVEGLDVEVARPLFDKMFAAMALFVFLVGPCTAAGGD